MHTGGREPGAPAFGITDAPAPVDASRLSAETYGAAAVMLQARTSTSPDAG